MKSMQFLDSLIPLSFACCIFHFHDPRIRRGHGHLGECGFRPILKKRWATLGKAKLICVSTAGLLKRF